MALFYVWSGATGTATGASWANAKTTLAAMLSASAAGDTIYVAHDHSETLASALNLFPPGTVSNPTRVICVNRAGSVPPVVADRRATAQVATSGDNSIQFAVGSGWFDGIIFVAGNSTGVANITVQGTAPQWTRLDNCSLQIGSTGAGKIVHTAVGAYVELNNTTMSFSGTGQSINFSTSLRWRNTPLALIGAQVPATLFTPVSSSDAIVECAGVDFSAAGSGKTLFGANTNAATKYRILDCKFNASVTRFATPSSHNAQADLIRTGSAGNNYSVSRNRISGLLTEETTIVRSGGASDGTTPISWKIVTTATCGYPMPFECPPIAIWNDVTGSAVTATVEGIWGGGAVPNDDDIWIDIEYLGDASSPQGSFVNDGRDSLAAAAGQASSSASWGGSTTKFKLNASFTAQQKGFIYARVKCAKASSTFYVDPLVTLS